MNEGLEAEVTFQVRPLTPILNDSSVKIIRPLVGTREKGTRRKLVRVRPTC